MGAGTVVRTGPSRAFQRIWAALAAWNPVPVIPTSWPALALMVERLTTGPDTHANAAAARTTPAAAEPTPANAHLRTDFILPPGCVFWLSCPAGTVRFPSIWSDGRPAEWPRTDFPRML